LGENQPAGLVAQTPGAPVVIEAATLGIGAAMVMGLAFGAGPCNITCLPYLGPVLLGADSSWRVILPFSLGRLFSYSVVGAAAGRFGGLSRQYFDGELGAQLLGVATIAMGLWMLLRAGGGRRCSKSSSSQQTVAVMFRPPKRFTLFAMGAGMALNPCAPLVTVLMAAALTGAAGSGLALGLAFGLGAVLIPTLVFAYLVSQLGRQIRRHLSQWRQRLEQGAGTLLMVLGGATLMGWVTV